MAELTERRVAGTPTEAAAHTSSLDHQAFRILHLAFIVAPVVAGLDKFFNVLTDWTQYLAPPLANAFGAQAFMGAVGLVEIVAGLLVLLKPKIGAYVVAAWLFGIICNLIWLSLLVPGAYYDIALRDVGLLLGALALGRLARAHEVGAHARRTARTATVP